jgi:hypothetical protein
MYAKINSFLIENIIGENNISKKKENGVLAKKFGRNNKSKTKKTTK